MEGLKRHGSARMLEALRTKETVRDDSQRVSELGRETVTYIEMQRTVFFFQGHVTKFTKFYCKLY